MSRLKDKQYGAITPFDLKRPGGKIVYAVLFLAALVIVLVCIIPPLWIMLSSFKSQEEFFRQPPTFIPEEFHPERIIDTWNSLNFVQYYLNSFAVVVGSVLCAVIFNGLLAYVLAILRPRGSRLVSSLVMVSLMIPATTSLVPLFTNIVGLGLGGTYAPLWFAAGANAFHVILFTSYFRSIPRSFFEAARLDGCGDFNMFFKIIVPLSKPIIMVIGMYAVNNAWSDFLLPYLVLNGKDNMFTVMVKLYVAREGGFMTPDQQMMCITFAIIPPVILFILFQKQITGGVTLGGVKE